MHDYSVFGGHLRSALALPELRPLDPRAVDAPDWTLTLAAPAPLPDARRLGAHRYPGDVEVALLAAPGRWRVATGDLGDFDLDDGGRTICWRPVPGAREDLARFDLLGRVLPLALYLGGALPLHGSSVVFPEHGAVAFVAPKGHGKSTLALALAQRGAGLLSDDVSVVEPRPTAPVARPGVHAVRLWEDSARRLDTGAYGEAHGIGRKLLVPGVPSALRAEHAAPLRAVYLLRAPDARRGLAPAERTPLADVQAAVALVRHTTAGNLLGGSEAPRVLARAAAVVRAVPVFALAIAHDFARLHEVAAAVAGWHTGEPAGQPARARAVAG